MATKLEGSPRERLLAAANELFYAEGVHTVGIDRVIERAGVAKASLYSTFGSKEELVREYLRARFARRQALLLERIGQHADPREKILSVFDLLSELYAQPSYRGCAFMRAIAEAPEDAKSRTVCRDYRSWLTGMLTMLARDAGAKDPELLGSQLLTLHDGATLGSTLDRESDRAAVAKQLARTLLDGQTQRRTSKPKRRARERA
jgi:AcrR family transcriptional regulator